MKKQVCKVGIVIKGYGPVNTITSFFRHKCGNFDQNPTASIKSYWEPGSRDPPLFAGLSLGPTAFYFYDYLNFSITNICSNFMTFPKYVYCLWY